MSRSSTLSRLGTRNAFRATGRLFILTLLLASALVARSVNSLSQASLCGQAVNAVTSGGLPGDANCIAYVPQVSFAPDMLERYISQSMGWGFWSLEYFSAYCDRYLGPDGRVSVVRPAPLIDFRTQARSDAHYERKWFTDIEGRYPSRVDEVAVPSPFARAHGLRPGDHVSLLPERGEIAPVTFTVSGVYEPLGAGAFYDYFLSVMDPVKAPMVNLLIGSLDPQAIAALRSWGGPNQAEVTVYTSPKALMRGIARTVYSPQSSAMALGFTLVGVAVLVVLLVAMVERRREAAIYKMVGLDGPATLSVLAVELIWSLAIAVALAAPAYWYLATRYVLDAHAGGAATLIQPFAASTAWTVVIAALGAFYPFALASVGTPTQLMNKQRIYLFRRKQTLRGWAGVDTE